MYVVQQQCGGLCYILFLYAWKLIPVTPSIRSWKQKQQRCFISFETLLCIACKGFPVQQLNSIDTLYDYIIGISNILFNTVSLNKKLDK